MAWIESHQSLAKHPKLLRAAKALGISRPTMVGHLHYLWWWALDFAEDGNLSSFSNPEIAEAAEWQGDPDLFCTAITEARFLSVERCLHDWQDYAGRLVASRQRNRDRQRTYRLRNAHVTVTSPLRNGATVPNPTQQYSTQEPPKSPVRRGTQHEPITEEFINLLVTEWSPRLGGEERTKNIIAEAMNHKAMDKRKDKRLYLKTWLRNEVERYGKEHTNGRVATLGDSVQRRPAGQGDFSDTRRYEAEAHRLAGERPASS